MTFPPRREKQRVAVVGSGMAGLSTAYLLNRDPRRRFAVTVFESGSSFALDQASVSVHNKGRELIDRIDLPMRAFAEGYYENLIRMYKYLGVQFRSQPFVYTFAKDTEDDLENRGPAGIYFVHSSNNHRIPPIRPRGVNHLAYFARVVYVAAIYFWWSICCALFPPYQASTDRNCESLGDYCQRIRVPQHWVDFYLLPLISSVATCSHQDLLRCPAKDVTDYKKRSAGKNHYTVAGVHAVQRALSEPLDAKLNSTVTRVEPISGGRVRLTWKTPQQGTQSGIYDRVVLAVAPDVVSKVYLPLQRAMSRIPSTTVTSFVTGDNITVSKDPNGIEKIDMRVQGHVREAQTIHFRTSGYMRQTESHHIHPSGAIVTTCPLRDITAKGEDVLKAAQFRRALRTPLSRRVVNNLFDKRIQYHQSDEKDLRWKNGDDNVWLVGGWCWDGMVLLEGCVISAMRVARDLDVDVPWDR